MPFDQVQHRKRRCGPKAKTGCATCKFRRIKCDEARPSCQRCSTTGRKCDGYSSDITITSQISMDAVDFPQRIYVHIPGSADEKRGFDFFLKNTIAELSGYYKSSFWEKLILAASAQNPSLRHAVIAIGTLHEGFSQRRLMLSSLPTKIQKAQFALNQYTKAIGSLRRSISRGKEDPLMALMSCVLFVCFDSLRGWFESAMVHLQSGLKILRDIKFSSTKNNIIEHDIAPLLMRLSIQSIIYVEAKSLRDKTAFARILRDVSAKEILMSEEFNSLEEARDALSQTAGGLFRAFFMWDGDLPVSSQPVESLIIYEKYSSQVFVWNVAFEKFMACKSKYFTSQELQGATLLKIHYTTAKLMANIRFDVNDVRDFSEASDVQESAERLNDFQIIINLSKSLIAIGERDAKNGKPPRTFSSDLGLIGPLYYVCISCPAVTTQTMAMQLLLKCPRREGMWDSILVAQMIQQYWDLQAEHKKAQELSAQINEFGVAVPFEERGAVHFAYFGRPVEINTSGTLDFSPFK